MYKNQFKYDKAEDMFLHALDMSERLLGKAHPHVLNRCVLPMTMAGQPSAFPLVKPTADQSRHDLFSWRWVRTCRYSNLLDCYEKWGRVDKAADVERKLVALRQYVADHPDLAFGD